MLWPRRTAGTALRVTYLVAPGTRLTIDGVAIDTEVYLRAIVGAHARERIAATVCVVGEAPLSTISSLLPPEVPVAALGSVSDAALARSLAAADADALVAPGGRRAATGPVEVPARKKRPSRRPSASPQRATRLLPPRSSLAETSRSRASPCRYVSIVRPWRRCPLGRFPLGRARRVSGARSARDGCGHEGVRARARRQCAH